MGRPKQTPMDLIVAMMKKNRSVTYAEVKAAADKRRMKMFPIMFGRAQLTLGIAKRKDGAAKAPAARGPGKPAGRRGRPPAQRNGSIDGLDALINSVRDQGRETERLRDALDKIRAVLESV